MKTKFLFFIAVLLSAASYAQSVIDHPVTGTSTARGLQITKIEKTDSTTSLFFHFKNYPGNWIYIPKESFIQTVGSTERLYLKSAENIPVNENYIIPESGETEYTLNFPALADSVSWIDYGEGNPGGNWFVYDIFLKQPEELAMVPKWLSGNWYKEGTDQWSISFLDSAAIYQSQLWRYSAIDLKNGKGTIALAAAGKQINLSVKAGKDQHCLIEISDQKMKLTKTPQFSSDKQQEGFSEIKIKPDTTILSGYIANYSPRSGVKTSLIYIDNILTGEQSSQTIEINPDGTFSAQIPLTHPQAIYCQSAFLGNIIYLEPGKPLFVCVIPNNTQLFMGETACLNSEFNQLQKCLTNNYEERQEKILSLSALDYKTYLTDAWEKDLKKLEDSVQTGRYSQKSIQVTEATINYSYAESLLGYRMYCDMAFRQKHNLKRSDRNTVIPIDNLTTSYFDFLTPELVNNPLALCSNTYGTFINRLKFLEEVRGENLTVSTGELYRHLKSSGYNFSESEEKTLGIILTLDSLQQTDVVKEFNKNNQGNMPFYEKFGKEIEEFCTNNESGTFSIADCAEYIKSKGINLSNNEMKFISEFEKFSKSPEAIQINELNQSHTDSIYAFHQRFNPMLQPFLKMKIREARDRNLQEKFGIEQGLATDVMTSQNFARRIVAEMTPLNGEELADMKQQFKTPEIADYLEICNSATLNKIALNKQKNGYTINEAPRNAGDKLFESIMEKYKGKVVYVDFWATWCGPCRSGIERIKPLKEELEGQDVVFVYITGPSSPENTWQNMIPDIKGEHYRVSNDEWNYLCGKFNISGIPHCTLVGKDGQVINPHLSHMENGSLKELLSRYL